MPFEHCDFLGCCCCLFQPVAFVRVHELSESPSQESKKLFSQTQAASFVGTAKINPAHSGALIRAVVSCGRSPCEITNQVDTSIYACTLKCMGDKDLSSRRLNH